MTSLGIISVLQIAAICVAAGFGVLWVFSRFDTNQETRIPTDAAQDTIHFLFEGEELSDATPLALNLVDNTDNAKFGWESLVDALKHRFPLFPQTAASARRQGNIIISSNVPNDTGQIEIKVKENRVNVALKDTTPATSEDRHRRISQRLELKNLHEATSLFPYPIWFSNSAGEITWINKSYDSLARTHNSNETPTADGVDMFSGSHHNDENGASYRKALSIHGVDKPMWFNVSGVPLSGKQSLNYAINIDAVVDAEIAQRKFVQTLTKTFAQLSIGLAIFDRNRQLALFNPALIDLTSLPADFLSARPNLLTFFDRLRENRMMPEPKNYSNWRQQIADLVVAASDGRYHETWSLASGLTYRVTGRPQPDGAIAILFEDISAEISLTRRFRTQLALGQSVIDTLDEAVAVFNSSGVLTLSNSAYRTLWKIDPDSSFADMTILDASRQWQSMSLPNETWNELRDFVVEFSDRTEWTANVKMKNGAALACRFTPLSGGATLVGFSKMTIKKPARLAAPTT